MPNPLLYTAAKSGEYHDPNRRLGPTTRARIPSRASDPNISDKLWSEAERLTETRLPD
ncbi:hypothetical protein [Nocardia pseudobrasiliensis]|uniref:Uncharacterized protein n=1 Tax=Nocardia pseudobrasiliensis TaxID=45979 RepID=A0A370IBL9_9NOCA|nr:hypothetical protein [Nocardia pseudobrasiliensis]RDI66794.1 hypothetical protein DFR76_104546 [Nocardia pseudobrasiliensis]